MEINYPNSVQDLIAKDIRRCNHKLVLLNRAATSLDKEIGKIVEQHKSEKQQKNMTRTLTQHLAIVNMTQGMHLSEMVNFHIPILCKNEEERQVVVHICAIYGITPEKLILIKDSEIEKFVAEHSSCIHRVDQ